MRLRSIPALYRNVRRWTEIVTVLTRHGLADWLSRFQRRPPTDGRSLTQAHQQATAVRIRQALTDLGPTFIKLGQLLSTRPDLVGVQLAEELARLRDDVPADPMEYVRQVVLEDLGAPVEERFAEFDELPLASASIGQVHRARLPDGTEVAVKVRRRGVERRVREDLEILSGLVHLAERVPELRSFRPSVMFREIRRMLLRELDYHREARNVEIFHRFFQHHGVIRVPRVYPDWCSDRILTMEFLRGTKLEDRQALARLGVDLGTIARSGAEAYLEMIFTLGIYHADPHPGNLLVTPDHRIGLLDFGMVGRLDEPLRDEMGLMVTAVVHGDAGLLASIIRRVGATPSDLDTMALEADLGEFVSVYTGIPLQRFPLASALADITDLVHHHGILLPASIATLLKTLISLEGTGRLLNPHFNLMELIEPFHRRLKRQRWSPKRRARQMRRFAYEMEHLVENFPRRVADLLEQVQSGRFDVHLDHRGLEPSVNRLVLGLLTSALFLASALLLSMKVPPLIFREPTALGIQDISLLGLAGGMVAVWLAWRLLRAIGKSGRLDRRA